MPQDLLDLDSLWSPLDGASPSGADLGYDPLFAELEQVGAGKPERQYGETIIAAEPPDWPQVHALALGLAARTRDLRLAVWLTRSGARLHGLASAAQGLQLLAGLLDKLWDSVHPALDESDNNDPTMRLNVLAALGTADAVLADVRAAAVAPVRGSLTVRDLELGLGRAEPGPGETKPTEAGVLQALAQLMATHPQIADAAAAAHQAAAQITSLIEGRVEAARVPDLAPLNGLLKLVDDATHHAGGAPSALDEAGGDAGPARSGGAGGIRGRADVVRELERVCAWIESHEPSNPAPLLIRRAQRLMDKSFIEIIRDLAPDGLGQVERIAGTEAS